MLQPQAGSYNFKIDLANAKTTEQEISQLLFEYYEIKTIEISKIRDYDLRVILPDKKEKLIEIKEDFLVRHTGNIALEFECRKKESGISITKADLFIYKLHESVITYWLTNTSRLKWMIYEKMYNRIVSGGDRNSDTMNYLFSASTFKKYSKQLFISEEL